MKITPTWNVFKLPIFSRNFPQAKITTFTVSQSNLGSVVCIAPSNSLRSETDDNPRELNISHSGRAHGRVLFWASGSTLCQWGAWCRRYGRAMMGGPGSPSGSMWRLWPAPESRPWRCRSGEFYRLLGLSEINKLNNGVNHVWIGPGFYPWLIYCSRELYRLLDSYEINKLNHGLNHVWPLTCSRILSLTCMP